MVLTPEQMRLHAQQLAAAFEVRYIETMEVAQMGQGLAMPEQRTVAVYPITDAATYVLALHEIGHVVAPSGYFRIDKGDTVGRALRLRLANEMAAWEWAKHYALDWTPVMAMVAEEGLKSYRRNYDKYLAAVAAQNAKANAVTRTTTTRPIVGPLKLNWGK